MNRLRDLRMEKGWNMSEAAKHFQLPYTTYVSYEKGERTPNFELVCVMAEYYDVSVTYLMGTADIRGTFPKLPADESYEDPWDRPALTEGEAEREEFIRLYQAAPAWLQEQVRSLLKAAEAGDEAQGAGPKE